MIKTIAYDFDGVFHKDIDQYKDNNGNIQGHTKDSCKNDLKICKPFTKIIKLVKKQKKQGFNIIICTHNNLLDKLHQIVF